ncbi:MAG TPA: DUF1854 domain-containing protein [Firmicutes bacterium]|nr:DUF1854 domain-containing protein [Bacillota bacterium]
MERLEPAPSYLRAWLEQHGIAPDSVELLASADLDEEGRFRRSWVLATRETLWVIPEERTAGSDAPRRVRRRRVPLLARRTGPPPLRIGRALLSAGGTDNVQLGEPRYVLPLSELENIRVESLTGNALLVASRRRSPEPGSQPASPSSLPPPAPLSPPGSAPPVAAEAPVQTQAVAGGAAKPVAEPLILCRFTNSEARKFGLFARLLEKLRQGEAIQESDLREDQVPSYCPRCGLMYPEPSRPVCPRCIDRRRLFLRVLSFAPRYQRPIALILLCMLASSALRLASPFLGGRILYDEVLTPGGRYEGQVGPIVLAIFGTQLLALLISIAHGRINSVMTAQVIFDLKTQVFAAMQRLSLRFFSSRQTGSLMTRVNHDAMQLQYFFHDGLPFFIVNVLMFLGVFTIMLLMNWQLALLVLLPAPAIIWVVRRVFPRLWELFSRRYRKTSALNALMNDALTGVRVVKAFGKEEAEIRRFGVRNAELYQVGLESGNLGATIFPAFSFIMSLGGLVVWGLGGAQVLRGEITFGTMMTFAGYLGMLYGPLEFMAHVVDWWSFSMNSAQRIFEILDAVPEVTDQPQAVHLPHLRGDIRLEHVTFGYEPHKPVLHNIDLDVRAGEMLGLVGHSGAGKSTMTNLITRLYDVDEGTVAIDGTNVRQIAIADLRSQIGMVLQDPFLFSGSIAENIAYARAEATPREILRAAQAANAHDFIVMLPDGYDTVIGHRGRDLSGGEKQRIEIARAILRDPRILILDEATSSMDTETEQKIQQALKRLVKDRTTIAIAHRLSTLRDADRLFVLEQGKNVESGTHEELVAKKGTYFKLLNMQREALKIRGVDEAMLEEVEKGVAEEGKNGLAQYMEIHYLDPARIRFFRTPGGFLGLTINPEAGTAGKAGTAGEAARAGMTADAATGGDAGGARGAGDRAGEEYSPVAVYRAFPLTRPEQYISVRDSEGKEIGMIENLGDLPAEMRRLVEEELERRYFTPLITRVVSVKEEFGYSYWEVETDRGARRFTVRNSHENVLPVGERSVMLVDVDGNRFAIPDYRRLAPAAYRQIESML